MAHLEGRAEIHGCGLLLNRFNDFWMAVAGIDAPQTGCAVEDLAAVVRRVMHAGGGYQHARFGLELPIGSEGHPEVVGIDRVGHGSMSLELGRIEGSW